MSLDGVRNNSTDKVVEVIWVVLAEEDHFGIRLKEKENAYKPHKNELYSHECNDENRKVTIKLNVFKKNVIETYFNVVEGEVDGEATDWDTRDDTNVDSDLTDKTDSLNVDTVEEMKK